MSECGICCAKTFKSREPYALTCIRCGKALCSAHAHYFVDGSNVAITRSARPTCATCNGMVTAHCFWSKCPHIVEHRDPEQASRIMQAHFDTAHAADLTALGFLAEDKHVALGGGNKTPEANAPTLFDLLDIEGSAA